MKLLCCAILFLSVIFNINSQQKDSVKNIQTLQKAKWSIQFEIGNDFKLTSFDGVIVSMKYHFSPSVAFRFGAGVNLNQKNSDIEYLEYYSGYSGREPVSDHSYDILFTSNILFYPKPNSLIKVFFGAGPRASYLNSTDERIYVDGYKGYRETETWSAGINCVAGAEWFALSYLSIFGEYSVYGTYGHSTLKDYVKENLSGQVVEYYNEYADNFQFKGNIVRLGLSVYF